MRKILLFIILILFAKVINAQLGIYDFENVPANCSAVPYSVVMQPANATFSEFSRVGVACKNNADVFNSDGWCTNCTSAPLTTDYVQFSITALAGATITATQLLFTHEGDNQVANMVTVAVSTNDFATTLESSNFAVTTGPVNASWDFTDITTALGGTITFRFSIFGQASAGSGSPNANAGYILDNVELLGSILPIELSSFTVSQKGTNNLLEWQTASETNNHYMAVERSTDGRQFQEIGRIMGAGTTNIPQTYTFTDEVPTRGLNYYRLRQVDFDGAMEYSEVVVVEFNATEGGLTVAPTDAADWVSVTLEGGFPEKGQLQVFDLNGRLLIQTQVEASMPTMNIDVRNLVAGQYLVRLVSDHRSETQRFFKR